jgi:hypothetical protein
MFELGTVGGVLANVMGGEIWGVEVFHVYDHHSQVKNRLFESILPSENKHKKRTSNARDSYKRPLLERIGTSKFRRQK